MKNKIYLWTVLAFLGWIGCYNAARQLYLHLPHTWENGMVFGVSTTFSMIMMLTTFYCVGLSIENYTKNKNLKRMEINYFKDP